jgi:serine/threonine-protein kinase RsbW
MTTPESGPQGERRSFGARMPALRQAAQFVRTYCARQGWENEVEQRLTLVLEELFTNTVRHGHQGDCEACVHITLLAGDDGVSVLYEDEAPAFDSVAAGQSAAALLDLPTAERPSGGMGLALVLGMSSHARHEPLAAGNRLYLHFAWRPQCRPRAPDSGAGPTRPG